MSWKMRGKISQVIETDRWCVMLVGMAVSQFELTMGAVLASTLLGCRNSYQNGTYQFMVKGQKCVRKS